MQTQSLVQISGAGYWILASVSSYGENALRTFCAVIQSEAQLEKMWGLESGVSEEAGVIQHPPCLVDAV